MTDTEISEAFMRRKKNANARGNFELVRVLETSEEMKGCAQA